MAESYYDVLGIDPDASETEIKRAYREKIKEVHPDHSNSEDAGERVQQVRDAKETLLDADARQRYDRKRERERQCDQETSDQDSDESSEEWARKQRRQGRRARQRQQQRQRHRQHRREQAKRSGNGKQTRASRQTETRTRERDETSSRERARDVTRSMGDRVRDGIAWVQDTHHRPRRWIWLHFHSLEAVRKFLIDLITSPTTIRLSAAVALVHMVTWIATLVDLSPATSPALGFVIVLGCLGASYAAYAVVTPLPFEEPRSRGRFKPAGRSPIWPAVAMNLTGIGLLGLAAINGAEDAGIGFTIASGIYTVTLLFTLSIAFTILLKGISRLFNSRIPLFQAVKYGIMSAPVGAAFVMFTQYADGGTLRDFVQAATMDSASTAPWLPSFTVGPVYLGSFANYVIAVVIIGCLFGSILLMSRYLTVVPWSDRYAHGYRVRPSIWNFTVVAPFTVLGWMVLASVSAIDIGGIELRRSTLWIGLFILPTILVGAYIVRRQLEPQLQERL